VSPATCTKRYITNDNSFVCTVDQNTKSIVRLRSYALSDESNISASICQAALATSAATTFFEPVRIGNRKFADGGLGANNPVDEVEGEAANIWCSESGDLKPLVKCFLSIGTGNPGIKAFEESLVKFLGKTVVDIATETEETEKRFIAKWRKHYDENRYFRFNVDQGLQSIGLDEYKQQGAMESATERYLVNQAQKNRVQHCIKNLELKESVYNVDFS
jgi:predicted acylesterase/phospholipase RssA